LHYSIPTAITRRAPLSQSLASSTLLGQFPRLESPLLAHFPQFDTADHKASRLEAFQPRLGTQSLLNILR
jgi:hypothetical protein